MIHNKNEGETMSIPCTVFFQHNIMMLTGRILLKDLVGMNLKIDQFHAKDVQSPNVGYQRAPEERRAKRYGDYISGGQVSPTSILLAIREEDAKFNAEIEYNSRKSDVPIINKDSAILKIKPSCVVYVVDGQHRIRGISDCDVNGKLANFALPFTMLWNINKFEEAKQFVTINKTQKIVRTDLAERFVALEAKRKGLVAVIRDPNQMIFKNAEWIGRALDILDTLSEPSKNSVWTNRVRLPNEPKGETTVSQKSFTDSLEPLIGSEGSLKEKKDCDIVDILTHYWDVISKLCKDPFDKSGQHNPNDYAIQQTIGVMALHRVLNRLYRNLWKVLKPEHFEKLLDVDGITNPANWDRTIINKDTEAKGGRWTLMGTNQKSFRIIEGDIMAEIKETAEYKRLEKLIAEG